MVVRALLADSAFVYEGKLSILGGGWSNIVAGAPFAVCGKIDIPWHQGTDAHTLRLELLDGDGQPVCVQADDGSETPIVVELPPYQAATPPNVKPGTALDWPFALNVSAGTPLLPGEMYVWKVSINGETQDDWTLAFSTYPAPLADAA